MFNDRDLAILGAGAIGAVLCLLLPIPFAAKAIAGILVLTIFMTLALLRLGPDRVPLEEWARRRIRYQRSARLYAYQRPQAEAAQPPPAPVETPAPAPAAEPLPVEPASVSAPAPPPMPARALGLRPLSLDTSGVGVYPLLTVFLAVVGIYFVVWLAGGGGEEIARFIFGGLP